MINPKLLRTELEFVANNLARRGFNLDKAKLIDLEKDRKELQIDVEKLRKARNDVSKDIGLSKSKGLDVSKLKKNVDSISNSLLDSESKLKLVNEKLDELTHGFPNLLHASVPLGQDESSNKQHSTWGTIRSFDFDPLDLSLIHI